MKYRYIVVGYNYEYYKYVYRQLNDISETVYVNCWPKSQYLRFFYSYYIAHKFPFVKIWTLLFVCFLKKIIKKNKWSSKDPTCFLLLAGGANNDLLKYGVCEHIKKSFINGKIVYFINDLIEKTHMPVELMKDHADLVYSFDPKECNRYGLLNHCIPYSDFHFPKNIKPIYDVAFVGAAKDRLKDILSIFFYLTERGVNCCFTIIGVPLEEQVQAECINYSGRISYEENLKILQNSNCILDIIQGESSGNTIRVGEAIIMEKRLLTNNVYTPQNGIFDENNMRIFRSLDDIDINFLKDRSPINYGIKEKMYPIDLLRCIDEKLSNK